MKKQADHQD